MPVSGMIKLPDANVWLALAFSDHAKHAAAKAWFDSQQDDSCAFCRVTQMALLRHLTNSQIMGKFVQCQENAWRTYEQLADDARVVFLPEPPNVEIQFRALTQSSTPSHRQWTDGYLAALALVTSAQLVTFDYDFKRFAGLDLLSLG